MQSDWNFIDIIETLDATIQQGSSALPQLLDALGDGDAEKRWRSIVALGWIGDAQAVPHLVNALADDDWAVRHSAVWALGMIRDEGVIDVLLNIFRAADSEEQVRYVTAMGLVNQANEQLNALLSDDTAADDEKISRPAYSALINPHFRAG